jgi:hypothetical protein
VFLLRRGGLFFSKKISVSADWPAGQKKNLSPSGLASRQKKKAEPGPGQYIEPEQSWYIRKDLQLAAREKARHRASGGRPALYRRGTAYAQKKMHTAHPGLEKGGGGLLYALRGTLCRAPIPKKAAPAAGPYCGQWDPNAIGCGDRSEGRGPPPRATRATREARGWRERPSHPAAPDGLRHRLPGQLRTS